MAAVVTKMTSVHPVISPITIDLNNKQDGRGSDKDDESGVYIKFEIH